MKSISLSLMAFVALLFAHINTAQAASDATEGAYVGGGVGILSFSSRDGDSSSSLSGNGFKVRGGYFLNKNIRVGAMYAQASSTDTVSNLGNNSSLDDIEFDVDMMQISAFGDYVFDNGLYFGAGVTNTSLDYAGHNSVSVVNGSLSTSTITVEELSDTGLGLRIGGYWQFDAVFVDFVHTVAFISDTGTVRVIENENNRISTRTTSTVTTDLYTSVAITVGYHF